MLTEKCFKILKSEAFIVGLLARDQVDFSGEDDLIKETINLNIVSTKNSKRTAVNVNAKECGVRALKLSSDV